MGGVPPGGMGGVPPGDMGGETGAGGATYKTDKKKEEDKKKKVVDVDWDED